MHGDRAIRHADGTWEVPGRSDDVFNIAGKRVGPSDFEALATEVAGVVLAVKTNTRLKHVEFVRLEPERALVVLVSEDGQVENRILALPPGLPTSALTEATNFLNARIRGRTLAEARVELERALEAGKARAVAHLLGQQAVALLHGALELADARAIARIEAGNQAI